MHYTAANHYSNADDITRVKDLLEVTGKGVPMQSLQNFVTVFSEDPFLKGAICHNEMTGKEDIIRDLGWDKDTPAITDTDMDYLQLYLETSYGLYGDKKLLKAIRITANQNHYHPVKAYLQSLNWDGKERIRHLLPHYLGAEESDYVYECTKLFLMGAITRVMHPGAKFDYVLCLVGSQGVGKSTLFRLLAVKDEWYSDDLKKLDDENVYRKLQGKLVVEFSEMVALVMARSNDDTKSFLSRQYDTYKVPYEIHPQDRPRRCVFGGTTNELNFLPRDESGNRRFLPVLCDESKMAEHLLADEQKSRDYIDQVWAEAMAIYNSGDFQLDLSPEMKLQLKETQKQFMQEDSNSGVVQEYLDHFDGEYVCTKQLYEEALGYSNLKPTRTELRALAKVMNMNVTGWKKSDREHRIGKYGPQKCWERIKDENGFAAVPKHVTTPFS